MLGKTVVMVLLRHSSERRCFSVASLFCLQELLICFAFDSNTKMSISKGTHQMSYHADSMRCRTQWHDISLLTP